MENLINKVLEYGLSGVIDKTTDELLEKDEVYQRECDNLKILESKYMKLDLMHKHRSVIEDYIDCLLSTQYRASNISYMAGIKDTLLFLNQVGLLKDCRE